MDVERAYCVAIVGGDENDVRMSAWLERVDDVEAVESGHLNIEEHDVGTEPLDRLDGLLAGFTLSDHFCLLTFEQRLQPPPRDRLVIDHERPQGHQAAPAVENGKRRVATAPPVSCGPNAREPRAP